MSNSHLIPYEGNLESNGRRSVGYVVPPGYPFADPFSADESKGFREQITAFLDLVVRRKYTFLAFLIATLVAVSIYTIMTEPTYESRAWVTVDLEQPSTSIPPPGGYADEIPFVRKKRSIEGEILLLKISNPIAEKVAARLLEMESPPGSDEPLGILLDDEGERLKVTALTTRVGNSVEFEPEGKGANIIRITAYRPDAYEAALIANMYAEEYTKLTQDANRAHLSASRRFLEEQEESWRETLYEAEEAVQTSGVHEGGGALDQKGSFLVEQVAQLEAQRDQLNIDLQMRQATLATLEGELEAMSPQLVERVASSVEQEITVLRQRIAEFEMDRKEILLRYPDADPSQIDHPRLRQIESTLGILRSDLNRLSQQYVSEVESTGGMVNGEGLGYVAGLRRNAAQERVTITGIQAQLSTLDRRIQTYLGQMSALPQQSLRIARLERTRQHAAQMYESVIGRLQEILIAEQAEPGYARVLREGGVPRFPAEPNVPRNLTLGILLGILLGGLASVVLDAADNRLFKPELDSRLECDVIGVIPDIAPVIKSELGGREKIEREGKNWSTSLVSALVPTSPVTEAYRHLRTLIQFSGKEKMLRKILVTSSSMGEGKSITACNLAIVMAQAGRQTLLIDADLRRPRLHELFGESESPGIVQFLNDGGTVGSPILHTSIDNLHLLPSGGHVDNASELLGSSFLRALLTELEDRFDVLIIDSPPVRAATDAAILSTQCDATILVAKAASTKSPELELAFRQLRMVGANVLGVLFNGFDVRMAYGYKYMYSKYDDYSTYASYRKS